MNTASRLADPAQPSDLVLEHLSALAKSIPLGLLLLDWDLRPMWYNEEAARVCAVWNHGEREGTALHEAAVFQVPAPVLAAAAGLCAQWNEGERPSPRDLSDENIGLHAHLTVRAACDDRCPAVHVHLDYRRPRADRDRAIDGAALALFARLSTREREVALRVREGLRTAEIAAQLHRSPLTIKTQLAAIFAKLGVRSRARVAALLNR